MTEPAAQPTAAQPGTFVEPFRAYHFKLVINGVTEGHFTECSGLAARVQTIKYREAGQSQIVHAMPGRVEYADVILRYGLTQSRELWDWFLQSINGTADRKNVSIVMLDSSGTQETMRWNLISAWPAEWRGAPLDALQQEVAIETLRLVYDRLERE
jgi:phage tail-like protein